MSDATGEPVGVEPTTSGEYDGLTIIDPEAVSRAGSGSDSDGSGTGRRRGRPKGSRNANSQDGSSASLKGVEIAPILLSIHVLLASRFGEHWQLDPDKEAKQLEKAIKNAMRHQDMMVTQKQLDYAMLCYVLAQVYGTRVVTSVMVARAEAVQKSQAPNVTPFRQGA